uniref:BPTI/Kunitz inhibitor domain-containing protein n=1 Tax=Varanus komodoensis TaxID=61221 RepID=A0A8D2IR33_VARKO
YDPASPQKCRLPPRYGWCKESFQNFYYDFKSSMCKTFIYSGCRGNGNNFVALLECCILGKVGPVHTGWLLRVMCLAEINHIENQGQNWRRLQGQATHDFCLSTQCKFVTRYYFDSRNKRCRPFTYGGCGGNANNFPSYHTCARECEPLGKGKELPGRGRFAAKRERVKAPLHRDACCLCHGRKNTSSPRVLSPRLSLRPF